jgi:anti-sigma28 factor (negative regulator of flagellin synthesis)
MATKKASSKKSHSKKASSKKASQPQAQLAKSVSSKLQPISSKLQLDLAIDASKVAAIKRCIEKGQLSITISRVNLTAGRVRLSDPYKYD